MVVPLIRQSPYPGTWPGSSLLQLAARLIPVDDDVCNPQGTRCSHGRVLEGVGVDDGQRRQVEGSEHLHSVQPMRNGPAAHAHTAE